MISVVIDRILTHAETGRSNRPPLPFQLDNRTLISKCRLHQPWGKRGDRQEERSQQSVRACCLCSLLSTSNCGHHQLDGVGSACLVCDLVWARLRGSFFCHMVRALGPDLGPNHTHPKHGGCRSSVDGVARYVLAGSCAASLWTHHDGQSASRQSGFGDGRPLSMDPSSSTSGNHSDAVSACSALCLAPDMVHPSWRSHLCVARDLSSPCRCRP